MTRMVRAVIRALLFALLTMGACTTAAGAGAAPHHRGLGFGQHLSVAPSYGGFASLTVDSFAYRDALPTYDVALAEVATGRAIGLQYGYAQPSPDGDFESDYSVTTTEPLVVGAQYEAYFHLHTEAFWHCSIYDPNGCSWEKASDTSARWRFVYTGGTVAGTPYKPKAAIELGRKSPWHAHGWKVVISLTSDGQSLGRQELVGEYRTGRGGWRRDGSFTTDRHGHLTLVFEGEAERTMYRVRYAGSSLIKSATSRPFSITRRR